MYVDRTHQLADNSNSHNYTPDAPSLPPLTAVANDAERRCQSYPNPNAYTLGKWHTLQADAGNNA